MIQKFSKKKVTEYNFADGHLHHSPVCQGAQQACLCHMRKLQICSALPAQPARPPRRIQGERAEVVVDFDDIG